MIIFVTLLYYKNQFSVVMKNDIENYFNAEYWRLKYFSLKGGAIMILTLSILLNILLGFGLSQTNAQIEKHQQSQIKHQKNRK